MIMTPHAALMTTAVVAKTSQVSDMATVATAAHISTAPRPSIALSMGTSALAPAMAAFITNPADVAKTRLNMERELRPGRSRTSVLQCWQTIYAGEGIAGLQRGLSFVLVRESTKNAFRLGLYDPLVDMLSGQQASSSSKLGSHGSGAAMPIRVAAGAISGGLSALIANPLDLLKTRLQLDPSRAAGTTASDALRLLVKAEGVGGLWRRGAFANVARSATATSLGLPANSKLKELANAQRVPLLQRRPAVRDALCALGASMFVVVAINPLDLVRTRLFSAPTAGSGTAARYNGMAHCAVLVAKTEGVGALWKGTLASFLRIGPHQCITFVLIGVLQRFAQK